MRIWSILIVVVTISLHAGAAENLKIGQYASRAIWTRSIKADQNHKAPAIILIPGSGEFGPEEMMPKSYPLKGSDGYPLLSLFAGAFQDSGFHTVQLGKPGVEFFKDWETVLAFQNFYDKDLWSKLQWVDLIQNVEEAIRFLRNDPTVDSTNIYLLGHSEGTVVASDVAAKHPEIKGVILLGYAGESIVSTLHWQTFDRQIDQVIASDIDSDHNGVITEQEAKVWPNSALFPPTFLQQDSWDWSKKPQIGLDDIRKMWLADPALNASADIATWIKRFPFWVDFASRNDIKETTASILGSVQVFTGEFDVNTPPEWATSLAKVCVVKSKPCSIEIVPGLTHKFTPVSSTFAGPHFNKVLDQGLNPVDPSFLKRLTALAISLKNDP